VASRSSEVNFRKNYTLLYLPLLTFASILYLKHEYLPGEGGGRLGEVL